MSNANPPSPTVLIIEDDNIAARFVSQVLSEVGLNCLLVGSCQGALIEAKQRAYDLIVMDQSLPDGDGPSLWQALQRESLFQNTKAIAISADWNAEKIKSIKKMGFSDVLQKPIARMQLINCCRELGLIDTGDSLARPKAGDALAPHPSVEDSAQKSLVLDDEAALSRCGSAVVLNGLRQLLRFELPLTQQTVDAAIQTSNWNDLQAILHKCKASVRFCGANALGDACESLSHTASSATALSDVQTAYRHWQSQLQILLRELG